MKNILMALAVAGTVYTGANAQTAHIFNTGYPSKPKVASEKKATPADKYTYSRAQEHGAIRAYSGTRQLTHTPYAAWGMESHRTFNTGDCARNEGKVCHKGPGGQLVCYKTDYATNFNVCKGINGYYVCCDPNSARITKM